MLSSPTKLLPHLDYSKEIKKQQRQAPHLLQPITKTACVHNHPLPLSLVLSIHSVVQSLTPHLRSFKMWPFSTSLCCSPAALSLSCREATHAPLSASLYLLLLLSVFPSRWVFASITPRVHVSHFPLRKMYLFYISYHSGHLPLAFPVSLTWLVFLYRAGHSLTSYHKFTFIWLLSYCNIHKSRDFGCLVYLFPFGTWNIVSNQCYLFKHLAWWLICCITCADCCG